MGLRTFQDLMLVLTAASAAFAVTNAQSCGPTEARELEGLDYPWLTVTYISDICGVLSRDTYVTTAQCLQRTCQLAETCFATNYGQWFDVTCNVIHNRTCLHELFNDSDQVNDCWIPRKRDLSVCQMQEEANECIVNAIEDECGENSAQVFRSNIHEAKWTTCAQ